MNALNEAKQVADQFRQALKTEAGPDLKLMQEFQGAAGALSRDSEIYELLAHTVGVDTATMTNAIDNDFSVLDETSAGIYSVAVGIMFAESEQAWSSVQTYFEEGHHLKLNM